LLYWFISGGCQVYVLVLMLSNSLKMAKISWDMYELRQTACKNIILTLVHVLVLLYESKFSTFYRKNNKYHNKDFWNKEEKFDHNALPCVMTIPLV
jgi:hypothetical protein